MDIKSFFQDFNPGKFLVYLCLSIFTYTFALRLDGFISLNYWIIFIPLWIWKAFVIMGAIVGSIVWYQHPRYRTDHESYVQYKTMLISLGLHLLILMFELLLCDKLETGEHLWVLVFVPLIFASAISIPICVWSFHHHKSFELELFCGINALQFIFLALKLDNFVNWSWMTIFTPSWVTVCVAILGIMSAMFLAITLIRSPNLIPEQRRHNLYAAVTYSFLIIPILIFQVLLISKLNDGSPIRYTQIVLPLMLSLLTLLALSFASKPQNPWWFGMRKDFCSFFLHTFPSFQEYGNVSYHCFGSSDQSQDDEPRSSPPAQTVQPAPRSRDHSAAARPNPYSTSRRPPTYLNDPSQIAGPACQCALLLHPEGAASPHLYNEAYVRHHDRWRIPQNFDETFHGPNIHQLPGGASGVKSHRKKMLGKLYMLPSLLSNPSSAPTPSHKSEGKDGYPKKDITDQFIFHSPGVDLAKMAKHNNPLSHSCIYMPD